jgi:predicted aspartyl protease
VIAGRRASRSGILGALAAVFVAIAGVPPAARTVPVVEDPNASAPFPADPNAAPASQTPAPGGVPAAAQAPAPLADRIAAARKTLDQDDYEGALAEARRLVESDPASAAARTLLGDALYRRGDFEECEEAYRAAVAADPNHAPAHFGVGRILRTLGRYGEAAESFHRAAALEPGNARYLRILSNHLARRSDVITMMTRYLEMPPAEDARIIDNVRAWVELLKSLGDEPLGELVSSNPTELPANVLKGQVYIKADVAGVAGQRFAFDTGATGLTVSPRLAARAKLKPIRPMTITGMGGKGTVTGDLVLIRSLTLGGVTLRNVTATVADPAGSEEGLMGPSLFGALRILIDLEGGLLGLRPHAPSAASPAPPGAPSGTRIEMPFRNVGGQIVVRSAVNGVKLNSLVDTGASASFVSKSAVSRVEGLELLPGEWMQGRSVGVGGSIPRKALRAGTLTFAGRDVKADGMAVVDLARFSRAVESEIYLVIGSPELAKFVVEIDYRTMTLALTARPR